MIKITETMDGWTGIHNFVFRDALTGAVNRQQEYHNVITTAVKTAEATSLAANITYGALGTGAGTPAASDTTLFTELFRKLVAGSTSSGNVISVTTFYGVSEGNGTLTEFGMFGFAATGAADSGTLINHVSIAEVKH